MPVELPQGVVTLYFSDIEGSTRLTQTLAPQRWAQVLTDYRSLVRQCFSRRGGVEIDTQGDGFFAAFSDAGAAVEAAVDVHRATAGPPWSELPLRTRIGLHTAEPVRVGPHYVGVDVHRAARVMAAGHGGQTLLTAATRAALTGLPAGTALRDLGAHRLKDLSEPQQLHQVDIDELPTSFPPLKTLQQRVNNLPLQSTSFIGRDREIAEVNALVSAGIARLVTLIGPGGVGKTRLALQCAADLLDDFPQGTFFVALAPVRDQALVMSAIADAIGLRQQPGRTLAESVIDYARSARVLLVVDNLEHLPAAATDLAALLAAAPGLVILATSRAPLRLSGERLFNVPPLPVGDVGSAGLSAAVAVFLSRASVASPELVVGPQHEPTVLAICRRLDGLPLALELAAARTRMMTLSELERRLDHSLALLTGGGLDHDPRQQTLRSCIAWSVDLLDAPHLELFTRLSVFAGRTTLDQIAVVATPEELGLDAFDAVAVLVDASLVIRSTDAAGSSRYVLLETVREYAAGLLEQNGATAQFFSRHAAHFGEQAWNAAAARRAFTTDEAYAALDLDIDNVRVALGRLVAERSPAALRAVIGLFHYWLMRGQLVEGEYWSRVVMDARIDAPDEIVVRFLGSVGEFPRYRGDYATARSIKQTALPLAERIGAWDEVAATFHDLSCMELMEGNLHEARRLMQEALDIRLAHEGLEGHVMHPTLGLGVIAVHEDDFTAAEDLLGRTYAFGRDHGEHEYLIESLLWLAESHRRQGRLEEATAEVAEAARQAVEHGYALSLVEALDSAGCVLATTGRFEDATTVWGRAARLRQDTQHDRDRPAVYEDCVAATRRQLPDDTFARAWEAGYDGTTGDVLERLSRINQKA